MQAAGSGASTPCARRSRYPASVHEASKDEATNCKQNASPLGIRAASGAMKELRRSYRTTTWRWHAESVARRVATGARAPATRASHIGMRWVGNGEGATGSGGGVPYPTPAKSTLESSASSTACPALLSYTLYADPKLAELAALFAADPLAILATNAIDFAVPDPADRILPAGLPLRVPVPCACSDGIHKATSVRYVARAGDTLASVAAYVYGGLTTPDWIHDSNGMLEDDTGAALDAGTTLFMPLHCACS